MRWLIWNTEHQGWRLDPEHGYTVRFWEAHRFDLPLARRIVQEGNARLAADEPPREIMVPAASPEEIEAMEDPENVERDIMNQFRNVRW